MLLLQDLAFRAIKEYADADVQPQRRRICVSTPLCGPECDDGGLIHWDEALQGTKSPFCRAICCCPHGTSLDQQGSRVAFHSIDMVASLRYALQGHESL